jgi:hypothetical protein
MGRSVGFKLHETGKLLPAFIKFLEEHRSSSITTRLALAWAQQPSTVQPAEWTRRLSVVRTFARYRSATDPRTEIPPPGLLPFQPKRARPYLYSEEEIRSLLALLSGCTVVTGAASCDRGPIIVCSDYSAFRVYVSAKHATSNCEMSI